MLQAPNPTGEEPRIGICRICGHPLGDAEPRATCPECAAAYHAECWNEMGGCATFGCGRMVETQKVADGPLSYWGATQKKCPMCAELIPMDVLECPLCQTKFPDVRPLTLDDLKGPREDPKTRNCRRRAGWLAVLAALGITSPLVLLFGGIWYLRNKEEIARAGRSTLALVRLALAVSAAVLVLVAGGIVVFESLVEDPAMFEGFSEPHEPLSPEEIEEMTSQAFEDMARLAEIAKSYQAVHGHYPESYEALEEVWIVSFPGEEIPIDPFDGFEYVYAVEEDGIYILSAGADGQARTGRYIVTQLESIPEKQQNAE